jgi:hypothetical protein
MKKSIVLILLLLSGCVYCQKGKKSSKATASPVIAKVDNISAELIKGNFYLFKNEKGVKKDTMLLKSFEPKVTPTDCKITLFTTKNIPLYCISWTEKSKTETKLKKEDFLITQTQIWNPATKLQLHSNTQTEVKIKETVFLDKNKTASETQEKKRNEGYLFALTPEGDFTLQGKVSQSKYSLNTTTMKFEMPPAPAKKKKNK